MQNSRLLCLSLVLVGASVARADVAFSTFGPGDSYDGFVGYSVSTSSSLFGSDDYFANQFVSTTSGAVSSISFAATYFFGSHDVTIELLEDDGSDNVGSLLGSWSTTLTGDFATANIYTFAASGPTLTSGSSYWLGMKAQDDGAVSWNWSSPAVQGLLASNYDTSDLAYRNTLSAFRVETQAVPEPASMAALGIGAAALLRRRKNA